MKECFKCHQTLPLSAFYAHPRMADGHLGKCKECTKRDVRENRRMKIEHYREFDIRRFREDADRRAAQYALSREMKMKYPERYRARYAVTNAVRDGRLVRQPCEVCGSPQSEGHHEDYSKPLEVRWLCRRHHEALHHEQKSA